ncbi:hypothetical protein B0H14DRAFT_3427129 [Mycena olivaceomarginata]|nr:hypothetical protein B0H14DRAFT_3427129 [Mycena olivaceomarginata]
MNTVQIFSSLATEPAYNILLKAAVDLLIKYRVDLRVLHIPGDDNTIDDTFSRSNWGLDHALLPRLRITSFQPPHRAETSRLNEHFAARPLPALPISLREAIDQYTDALTLGISTVLEAHVPLSQLSELLAAYSKAHSVIAKDDHTHPSWAVMRTAKNEYHGAIRREKRTH